MGEFSLIEMIRVRAGQGGEGVSLGIGDDAALMAVPAGYELAATTDTLNAGVHFDIFDDAASIGHKALAVNLSDLAAMGANPRWVLLSISLPEPDAQWLEQFVSGFLGLAEDAGVTLVGGDTCSGPLSVGVTALGIVPRGEGLTRAGARPGDLVVVSGVPGTAALALARVLKGESASKAALKALHWPLPRIGLGTSLVGNATACIDISDGLLADLGHIVAASACGAVLEVAKLPGNEDFMHIDAEDRWNLQLTGGDDYELCFTLPPALEPQLRELSGCLDLELSVVGVVVEGEGVHCVTPAGSRFEPVDSGYEHFK